MRTLIVSLFMMLSLCDQSFCQTSDSIFIERVLREAPAKAGTLHFARLFLGCPYVAHTLEVNYVDTFQQKENDRHETLIVNTRELDCTTLVENVVALTICHQHGKNSFRDFCQILQTLRYRQGIMDEYPSRLHYFTDWIVDKQAMGIVKEVQKEDKPFTALQTINVNYMSRHPQSYSALRVHPEYVKQIAAQEQVLKGMAFCYIPKAEVSNTSRLREVIKDGDILAITCSKSGLDIAHLGFAVWHKDGLHLLNASSIHHKVVEEPMTLRQYLYKHPTHTGIRVIRLVEQ